MTTVTEHDDVNPVVAEVVRSGFAESRHRGASRVALASWPRPRAAGIG
jgi:L-asparaginase II